MADYAESGGSGLLRLAGVRRGGLVRFLRGIRRLLRGLFLQQRLQRADAGLQLGVVFLLQLAGIEQIQGLVVQRHGNIRRHAGVVGAPTSGKGYSQQTFMLSDGSSVHISTTRYYTPKGNSLADTGMTPDILVETDTDQLRQLLSGDLADADDTQLQAGITALNALVSAAANTDSTPAE